MGRIEALEPAEDVSEGAGTLVEFVDADGESISRIVLGKQVMREGQANPMFGGAGGGEYPVGRYLRRLGEDSKVFLVSEAFSSVDTNAEGWLNRDFFKVSKARSIRVTSSTNEETNWHVYRETEAGTWALEDPQEGDELDSAKTSSFNSVLSSPSFADVSKSEFDSELEAEIVTFDGFTYTLQIGEQDEDSRRAVAISVAADLPSEREAGEDETGGRQDAAGRGIRGFAERADGQARGREKVRRLDLSRFQLDGHGADEKEIRDLDRPRTGRNA